MRLGALARWWSALVRHRGAVVLAVAGVAVLAWMLTADDLNGILGPSG